MTLFGGFDKPQSKEPGTSFTGTTLSKTGTKGGASAGPSGLGEGGAPGSGAAPSSGTSVILTERMATAAARETAALLQGQKLHWPYVVLPGIEPGHPRVFRSEFYPTRRTHGPLALAPDAPPGVAFPPDAAAIFAAALTRLP